MKMQRVRKRGRRRGGLGMLLREVSFVCFSYSFCERCEVEGLQRLIHGGNFTDDFEVSIFLTETSTSHAMLTKQKTFSTKPKLESNAKKLTEWMGGANTDTAIRVDEGEEVPAVLLEEDGEEVSLQDIPELDTVVTGTKRSRGDNNNDDEHIFIQSEEDDDEEEDPTPKRRKKKTKVTDDTSKEQDDEDKKKLGMKTSYEGFSIYGRILCLIVKRKGVKKSAGGNSAGSQMLENWVSTQADNEGVLDDAEDG
jgi:hypothetical protein